MQSADYFSDTLPKVYTVLGVTLQSLTAGHIIRLSQLENTFLLGGPLTLEDLALGVFICSRSWNECGKMLANPALPIIFHKWQKALCGQTGLLYWLGLRKPKLSVDFAKAFILFSQYLKDGLKIPNVKYDASNTKETGCPLVLWVLNKVESKTAWTRAQLLDRPWIETLFDWLTLEAQDGNIDGFLDKETVANMEDAAAIALQMAKERGLA